MKFFGKGSPIQLYCSQANVNTHHKLKAKLKSSIESGTDLEYTDPETNATAKLSDDDIFEINAFQPFKAAMQNETGPKRTHQVDITRFFRNDFTSYLGDYDPDDPDEYEYCMAKAALATATHEANKLHEAQMKQLASTTANAMTAGGTTDTTSSSGGSSSGGGVIPTIDPLATEKKALKKAETPDSNAYTPLSRMTMTFWAGGRRSWTQLLYKVSRPNWIRRMSQSLQVKRKSLLCARNISTVILRHSQQDFTYI